MCRWVSIIPGITIPPRASISVVPSGTSRCGPTAAIRSSTTSTSASVRTVCELSMVRTVPPRSTTGRPTATSLSGWDIRLPSPSRTNVRTAVRRPRRDPFEPSRPRCQALHAAAGVPSDRRLTPPEERPQTAPRPRRTVVRQRPGRGASMSTPQPVPGGPPARGPLAGLLVADFSRVLAGPYATMLLADLGAEVVKVEGPTGDDTRSWQPPVRDGVATYYLGVNRNKRSIALDLKDAGDVAAARELARRADVLIENFRPGGLARFGLDYDTVAATNPRVVYASISGFGSQPGGAALPGYDLIVQAISGLMSLTGDPGGEPFRAGISVFDVMAGLHATIGVLSALNLRHETGRGQHVEVNLLSSALSGLVNHASAVVAGGVG